MKKVLDILKDASAEQRSRVKEAVQAAMQDGSLQVEFLLKEKNSKILQLEQARHKAPTHLANDGHWNAFGHRTVAAAIARMVREQRLLQSR